MSEGLYLGLRQRWAPCTYSGVPFHEQRRFYALSFDHWMKERQMKIQGFGQFSSSVVQII